MRKIAAVIAFSCLATAACSTSGRKVDGSGAELSSIDIGLPDKSKLDKKVADALTAYALLFQPLGTCPSAAVAKTDAYAAAASINAKINSACAYKYSLMLGTPEMLAKGESYFLGDGTIDVLSFKGKKHLDLKIELRATPAAAALGFPAAIETPVSDVDVAIQASLPEASGGGSASGSASAALPVVPGRPSGADSVVPAVPVAPSAEPGVAITEEPLKASDLVGTPFVFLFAEAEACPTGFVTLNAANRRGLSCKHVMAASEVKDAANGEILFSVEKPATTACPLGLNESADGKRCEGDPNSQEFLAANGIVPV